jgi:titin
VLNTSDSGPGSLRQAILDANADTDPTSTINFNIGEGGAQTITSSALPSITHSTLLDGWTQPGWSGTPLIELNGSAAGAGSDGLTITAANCTVRGVVVNQWAGSGIVITGSGATGNVVEGNYIGTNAAGTAALGNGSSASDAGVLITNGADGNTVGGTAAGAGNLISGNIGVGVGVWNSSNTVIRGNYIGTNAAGTGAIGNAAVGVYLIADPFTTVGGGMAGAGNVVSGNLQGGIVGESDQGRIQGNYVGTTADGAALLSNQGFWPAVAAADFMVIGVDGDGVNDAGEGNVIAGTSSYSGASVDLGVHDHPQNIVLAGNRIGTNAAGTAFLGAGPVRIAGVTARIGTNSDGVSDDLERNIIDGGLLLNSGTGHVVAGNYFDTDVTGQVAFGGGQILIGPDTTNVRIGTNADGVRDDVERNVIIGSDGIWLANVFIFGSNNSVAGNYIGVGADGVTPLGVQHGSDHQAGVFIANLDEARGSGNTIGGTAPAARNIISGNTGDGVRIQGYGGSNVVAGNYIGTDKTGAIAVPNALSGITLAGDAHDNTIGGTTAGARNIISGNSGNGVTITGDGTTGNVIEGNYIGTNAAGTAALGNGSVWSDAGIRIDRGATHNTIGGTAAGAGNVISGNNGGGIITRGEYTAIQGNFIGTDASGTAAVGNAYVGIWMDQAAYAMVGGGMPGARNVISGGLGDGIYGESNQGRIQGNYIGVDATGTVALFNNSQDPRHAGAVQADGDGMVIGVDGDGVNDASEGNVIVGTGCDAITIGMSGQTQSIVVAGNKVGTNAAGTAYLGAGPVRFTSQGVTARIGTDSDGVSDDLERNVIDGGLLLDAGIGHIVAGNYFNTDSTGLDAMGDGYIDIATYGPLDSQDGEVRFGTNADGIRDDVERNVLAAGTHELIVWSSNNVIAGNFFGVGPDGVTPLNPTGPAAFSAIVVTGYLGGGRNTIGGTAAAARNVIANDSRGGIDLQYGTSGNAILGNYIGTDATGTHALGNATGILVESGAHDNLIGGTTAGARNIISGNGGNGVIVDGANSLDNAIRGNLLYGNGGTPQAIDLVYGGNASQPAPVLTSAQAVGSTTTIKGTLAAAENTSYVLDFFSGSAAGQAQVLLGSATVTPNGSGTVSFDVSLPATANPGDFITATATDPNGNTSELSANTTVIPNAPPTVNAGGPYEVNMGNSLTLTATADDPNQDPLTYAWDMNGDGLFDDALVAQPTFNWSELNNFGFNKGQYTVRVQVSDGFPSHTVVSSATVTVTRYVYWDGGGDGINWDDPGNWSINSLPGVLDDAVIGSAFVVNHSDSAADSINSLVNHGSLTLSTGSLTVAANSTFDGRLTLDGGALIGIGQPTAGVTGTVDDLGAVNLSNITLDLTGATLTASAMTMSSLRLENATLLAAEDWVVTGPFLWLSGTLDAGSGAGSLTANGGMTIAGGEADHFSVINAGNAVWSSGNVCFNNGNFTNLPDATLDDQTDGAFGGCDGGCPDFFNYGVFTKSGGTSTTQLQMVLHNAGGVFVNVGTLFLTCGIGDSPPTLPGGGGGGGSGGFVGPVTVGDYHQSASGVLVEEIGGLTTDKYGQIIVHGTVSLAGILQVQLTNDFAPSPGDEFRIIDNLGPNRIDGNFAGLPEGATVWAGARGFTISYASGDGNDVVLTARWTATTTGLSTSVNPAVWGQALTFTATVNPAVAAAGTPTGTVQFLDNGVPLGSASLVNGTAAFSIGTLALGNHSITASYLGDDRFTASDSSALSQKVNPADSRTVVTASVNPSKLNQAVTFTATVQAVAPGAGTPGGTVQFQIDGVNYGPAVPVSGGSASLTLATLPVNAHTITAVYLGEAHFNGSQGSLQARVDYQFAWLLATSPYGLNTAIPLRFRLTDVNGTPVVPANPANPSQVVSLRVQLIDAAGNPVGSPFAPRPKSNSTGWSYNGPSNKPESTDTYEFNWDAGKDTNVPTGFKAGSATIMLSLDDGSTTPPVAIGLRKNNGGKLLAESGNGAGGATDGQLLAGMRSFFVNTANGNETAEELARVRDAVAAVNDLVAPYGVSLVEVSAADSESANLVLDVSPTSALGGFVDGVLGCATDDGHITLIAGWDWYAGADPGAVGAAQYDFQTAVTHELGHALGLGHSTDASSVMYATLAPGVARRTLTVANLNLPDGDDGPHGLRAGNTLDGLPSGGPADYGLAMAAMTSDLRQPALEAVIAEWGRGDDLYSQPTATVERRSTAILVSGSTVPIRFETAATTMRYHGAVDVLTGRSRLDWFFANDLDLILQPGSVGLREGKEQQAPG